MQVTTERLDIDLHVYRAGFDQLDSVDLKNRQHVDMTNVTSLR